jgi:Protein of unknown function (DUF3768)
MRKEMMMGHALEDDVLCGIGTAPTCKACGSEHVSKDAWACWNPATGLWELETTFDHEYCHLCEGDTSFVWQQVEQVSSRRLRALNDKFRREGAGADRSVVITAGVLALGDDFIIAALQAIRDFDAFTDASDPWGEHDYGKVTVDGQPVFWKIDYYDLSLAARSNNPANEGETHRVLTVMLPSEY